jgi:hypothetical protein
MESAYVHWVLQRNAHTAALITFKSFTDYKSAEAHKTQLDKRGDPQEVDIEVTIETLPVGEFPGSGQHPGTGRSAQRG